MTGSKLEPQFKGRVLSIAGLDPSGGAGLLADIKTISTHRCYGTGVTSALTVQNTYGVSKIEPVDEELVAAQIKSVFDDMGINAIKIGMLNNERIINAIAAELNNRTENYIVVVDPVLKSSSGFDMLNQAGQVALVDQIFPLTTVVTPNIPEAEILTGLRISSKEHMVEAAEKILAQGVGAVLLTGGHLVGETVVDVLLSENGVRFFESEKIDAPNNHGTGCALSTSLACHLSLGLELDIAADKAVSFVQQALKNTRKIGGGNGPINIDGIKYG